MSEVSRPPSGSRSRLPSVSSLQVALPFVALLAMLAAIFTIQPGAMSYFGFTLLFKLSVPLMFAALGQMLIIMLGDIDLSSGAFVGLITCITAVFLDTQPLIAVGAYGLAILFFTLFGQLIHYRSLPSVIVTLGMSFIWLGMAIITLPSPGGAAPTWLSGLMSWKPPLMPLPIWIALILAIVGHVAISRSSFGVLLRAVGGNPRAVERAGWSVAGLRAVVYGCAAGLACLGGITLTGLTTSGDPNVAPAYTLLGVGAVILGGGSFAGGVVSPVGTVVGALTLALAGSLLSFLHVPSTWQIGAQGFILFLVLAGRVLLSEKKS